MYGTVVRYYAFCLNSCPSGRESFITSFWSPIFNPFLKPFFYLLININSGHFPMYKICFVRFFNATELDDVDSGIYPKVLWVSEEYMNLYDTWIQTALAPNILSLSEITWRPVNLLFSDRLSCQISNISVLWLSVSPVGELLDNDHATLRVCSVSSKADLHALADRH